MNSIWLMIGKNKFMCPVCKAQEVCGKCKRNPANCKTGDTTLQYIKLG